MKNAYIKIFIAAFLCVTLSSCLDDDKAALDPSGTQNIIEFADLSVPTSPAGAIYPAWTTAFAISPEDEFEAIISYSGPNDNDRDIVVTLAVDPISLAEFNFQMDTLNRAGYELLPDANFDIPNLQFTIPAGQTKVSVPITVYPDKFDLSKRYAIPLKIVSASHGVLSAHFSSAILATVVKNKYDATYDTEVGMSGWSAFTIYDGPPIAYGKIGLATTGPNSVGLQNLEANSDLLPGFSEPGPAATQFGDASPIFFFDDDDKVTLIDNVYAGNARGRRFELNPAATATQNVFNEDDRSVEFNFLFKQNGRPDNVVIMKMEFDTER